MRDLGVLPEPSITIGMAFAVLADKSTRPSSEGTAIGSGPSPAPS